MRNLGLMMAERAFSTAYPRSRDIDATDTLKHPEIDENGITPSDHASAPVARP